jgi:hypothetical protein
MKGASQARDLVFEVKSRFSQAETRDFRAELLAENLKKRYPQPKTEIPRNFFWRVLA